MTALSFWSLAGDFALLSLLSIGGVNAILADSQRLLVQRHGLLDEAGFAQAVALGQAAPGPNILVVAVLGWMAAGPLGLLACLGGILLPSTLLVWRFARWAEANRQHPGLRAFQVGSAPLVLGLTLAGAALLAQPYAHSAPAWGCIALVALGSLRWGGPPLLWLALGGLIGALCGALGWI
ncbi:chromate transporter [Inhella inkyongensis]|uniref:Chromate transporter n=1 Tax=Inhella inkyongensis TaxID=392593 RepID=A0A840S9H0_9BURK|nr:chromate transporter [Inhella inkyongensis]MBB5206283.1 chromate transporter [Inhella inkyongensis]